MSQSHTSCKQIYMLAKFSLLICLVMKIVVFLHVNSFIIRYFRVLLKLTIKAVKYIEVMLIVLNQIKSTIATSYNMRHILG